MVYGVVAEFNPFHNGHKLLLEKADGIVISVTSSSFVQRGDISFINKFDKTVAALKNGVDIALELPAVYSLASAEIFARSAVEILKSCSVVDKLIFGSECGDAKLLKKAASSFSDIEVQKIIKKNMKNKLSYPKAVYNAVSEVFGNAISAVFGGPNDVLAVEYIRALQGSEIEPLAVKRIGSNHDSKNVSGNIASAGYIRDHFEEVNNLAPSYSISDTASIINIDRLFAYKLSHMTLDEIRSLPDVSEGLENRIKEAAGKYNSFSEMCDHIKTKRYTMARVRRIMCCALLGITSDIQQQPIPYIRVLGVSQKGKAYLSVISKNCALPLLTNPGRAYSSLSGTRKKILDTELLATRLWFLASNNSTSPKNELSMPLIVV